MNFHLYHLLTRSTKRFGFFCHMSSSSFSTSQDRLHNALKAAQKLCVGIFHHLIKAIRNQHLQRFLTAQNHDGGKLLPLGSAVAGDVRINPTRHCYLIVEVKIKKCQFSPYISSREVIGALDLSSAEGSPSFAERQI